MTITQAILFAVLSDLILPLMRTIIEEYMRRR